MISFIIILGLRECVCTREPVGSYVCTRRIHYQDLSPYFDLI